MEGHEELRFWGILEASTCPEVSAGREEVSRSKRKGEIREKQCTRRLRNLGGARKIQGETEKIKNKVLIDTRCPPKKEIRGEKKETSITREAGLKT